MRPSRPPEPPEAPPKDTPFARYVLLERLAVGGMAEVFLALEPRGAGEPRSVVIKRMLPHVAEATGAAEMFGEEARLGRTIEHPNVVRVLDFGEHETQPYLVLEHVAGVDLMRLSRWLEQQHHGLGLDVALFVACELLAGLHAVHEARDDGGSPLGIVHGDVSPSNVLLSLRGDVKLADFGIAEARLRSTFPQAAAAGRTKGKLGYLAPEQVRGEPSDRRSDVFAAAVVASELLIGEKLFARGTELSILLAVRDARIEPLLERASSLPEGLVDVLAKGLARDPADRYPTAAQLRMALERFADGPPAALRAELASVVAHAAGERRGPEIATPPLLEEVTREPPLEDYLVARKGGGGLGPLTFAQLVEAITRGRVGADDSVAVAGGAAKRLGDIPELAGHFPGRTEGGPRGPAGTRRPMRDGAFVEALAESAAAKADGVWICNRGDARKEVYLEDGVPVFVSSNLASELLGEFLVARGVLGRGELDMALAILPRFDGRLGDTLTALGLVEPVELFRHISDQVREKLLELFTWKDGEAQFERGVSPPDRYFPLGLDPWKVLGEGIERRLAQGLEQETFATRMMDPLARTATRAPDGLPRDVLEVLDRTHAECALHELVDALDTDPRDHYRSYRAVRLALALDLVRWSEA